MSRRPLRDNLQIVRLAETVQDGSPGDFGSTASLPGGVAGGTGAVEDAGEHDARCIWDRQGEGGCEGEPPAGPAAGWTASKARETGAGSDGSDVGGAVAAERGVSCGKAGRCNPPAQPVKAPGASAHSLRAPECCAQSLAPEGSAQYLALPPELVEVEESRGGSNGGGSKGGSSGRAERRAHAEDSRSCRVSECSARGAGAGESKTEGPPVHGEASVGLPPRNAGYLDADYWETRFSKVCHGIYLLLRRCNSCYVVCCQRLLLRT